MKKKLLALFSCFSAFYLMLQLMYLVPDMINGQVGMASVPRKYNVLSGGVLRLLHASLFCIIPYLILHHYFPRKKIAVVVVGSSIAVLSVFLIGFRLEQLIVEKPIRLRTYFLEHVFFYCVYLLFGLAFYFVRYAYHKDLQQKELLIQSRQSELSFLRSQINPHFLFNSLNNIYALVYHNSAHALNAIAGLSELLRYMLYDTSERVPLEREMNYIKLYVDLQRLRYEAPIMVDIHCDDAFQNVHLPPLLLIPFVENAFKHGNLTGAEGLKIRLQVNEQQVLFYCVNEKGNQQKDAVGGIGLENVKRRLQLLYPGKHMLKVQDEPNKFAISLALTHE